MKRLIIILSFFTITTFVVTASDFKCWVEFTDKDSTLFTLDNPSEYLSDKAIERRTNQGIAIDSTDLPVNQLYIDSVIAQGVSVLSESKWLNGVTISVPDTSV
jgi:serine protease AprX